MDQNNRHIEEYRNEEQDSGTSDDKDNDDVVTVLRCHVTDLGYVARVVLTGHLVEWREVSRRLTESPRRTDARAWPGRWESQAFRCRDQVQHSVIRHAECSELTKLCLTNGLLDTAKAISCQNCSEWSVFAARCFPTLLNMQPLK